MSKPMLIPKIDPYLTIIPGRTPEQKLHSKIGHAKNAFSQASYYKGRWGQLFEWKDGEWSLLFDIPEPQVISQREGYNGSHLYSVYGETRPWRLP